MVVTIHAQLPSVAGGLIVSFLDYAFVDVSTVCV